MKTCFIQLDYFAYCLNDFFKYKLYRQKTGILFFLGQRKSRVENISPWKKSRRGNGSLRRRIGWEKYVLINVADESDEDLIERSRWRSNDITACDRYRISSFARTFVSSSRGLRNEGSGAPPFLKSCCKSTSAIYVFDLTTSSTEPEAPAMRLNSSSSRVLSRTQPRGWVCSSDPLVRPRRPYRLPLLWSISIIAQHRRNRLPTTRSSESRWWTSCSSTTSLWHRYRSPRDQLVRDKLPAGWHDSLPECRPSPWSAPCYIDPRWCWIPSRT